MAKKDELDKYRNRGILLEGKVKSEMTNALVEGFNYALDLTGKVTKLSPKQKKLLDKLKFKKLSGKKYAHGGGVRKTKLSDY